jgi:threonine dehydrogenase-like Zn-dependent dehydrogenase
MTFPTLNKETLMATFKAAVIPRPGAPVEVREIPEPQLEPGGALLQVDLSEVCGTDVHLQAGRLGETPYPFIPGHVSVGRLAKIRGQVLDVDGRPLSEGDAVTFLDVHRTCNACWQCLVARASTRCPQRKVYGITYGLDDGLTGGWAEAIHLKAGTHCLRLDGVDQERFMAGGCALPTALHAVQRAGITLGDTVLVLGSGPVGLSAVILARLQGAARVLCIGAPAVRVKIAAEVGASHTLDMEGASEEERFEWVRSHTGGRGADVTIEATGAPVAVVQALRWTRDAGRVVVVGQYTDHGEVSFNPHLDLNKKHLDVRGCWGSDFSHFYRGVQLMANAELSRPWGALTLQRYGLEQTNEALAEVASGRAIKALIDPAIS